MARRKATPAQLRALAKGRKKMAAKRRAKKKATKRTTRPRKKTTRRRNPAGYKYSTIRLRTKNDTSGNPRRIFVVLSRGSIVGIFDEGYSGEHAITVKAMRDSYAGVTIDVTPTEYREMKKLAGRGSWDSSSQTYVYDRNPRRRNPVHTQAPGSYLKARSVLRPPRQNPRRKTGPGYRGFVIASVKPGTTGRVEFWDGQKFGPFSNAATYSMKKNAEYAAKKCRRRCAVGSVNTAPADFAKALLG